MSNCSSGCPTQDHATYGQCMKAKGAVVGVITPNQDYANRSRFWTEIKEYREAKAQGIQPKSSKLEDIRAAVNRSQRSDTAVQDLG